MPLLVVRKELVERRVEGSDGDGMALHRAEKPSEIFKKDPFQVIDFEGIGQLMETAVAKGRKVKKDLKLGICGEHGGEPDSVKFCHSIGLNYVSCSPFRVPIARLAAAQAVLEEKAEKAEKAAAKTAAKTNKA